MIIIIIQAIGSSFISRHHICFYYNILHHLARVSLTICQYVFLFLSPYSLSIRLSVNHFFFASCAFWLQITVSCATCTYALAWVFFLYTYMYIKTKNKYVIKLARHIIMLQYYRVLYRIYLPSLVALYRYYIFCDRCLCRGPPNMYKTTSCDYCLLYILFTCLLFSH